MTSSCASRVGGPWAGCILWAGAAGMLWCVRAGAQLAAGNAAGGCPGRSMPGERRRAGKGREPAPSPRCGLHRMLGRPGQQCIPAAAQTFQVLRKRPLPAPAPGSRQPPATSSNVGSAGPCATTPTTAPPPLQPTAARSLCCHPPPHTPCRPHPAAARRPPQQPDGQGCQLFWGGRRVGGQRQRLRAHVHLGEGHRPAAGHGQGG